ncbi:MAG: hypothetical protein WC322_02865 [Candidatus Paceibacterota bacterium]|jgi:hypothetical protein
MTTRTLKEAASFSLGKVTGANKWRCKIIQPGKGSTGFYSEEAIRESGPAAFPAGTKTNADHQGFSSWMDYPAGTVTSLIGALVSTPEYSENGTDGPGLYSEIEFSQDWAPVVEQFAPILGLSISAGGWVKTDEHGEEMYTEDGLPVIGGFVPSPLNTVDLVTVAGAGGKLLELAESYTGPMLKPLNEIRAKIGSEVSGTELHNDGKDNGMTPEEIQALKEALVAAITAAIEPLKEALVPAAPVDDADQAPEISEVVEAVVAADLPKSARAKVLAAVKGGAKIEEAITAEKGYIKELTESLKDGAQLPEGHIKDTATAGDFIVGGWGSK